MVWRYCQEKPVNQDQEDDRQEQEQHEVNGDEILPDTLSTDQDTAHKENDTSLDWDNYASEPYFLRNRIQSPKKLRLSSTRDDFIDEPNKSTNTTDDEAFLLDHLPPIPPRARSRTSVIQCNSNTCKPRPQQCLYQEKKEKWRHANQEVSSVSPSSSSS